MNKKQFITRLNHIYHNTKRQPGDSSPIDLRDAFLQEVIAKSNGGWDESVAIQTMQFVECIFNVQPEAVQAARRITSDDAEMMLKDFLTDRGYSYEHMPESKDQSPDGYIDGFGRKYACEIKSPFLMFDHSQAPFGYKHSTTHNKILDAIHKAKKQLETPDPDHALPHILIYTSAHMQLSSTNFRDAIRGYIAMQDGTIMTDLRDRDIYQNTKGIFEAIDLYIWLQLGGGGFHQATYFYNENSKHKSAIQELVNKLRTKDVQNGSASISIQGLSVSQKNNKQEKRG